MKCLRMISYLLGVIIFCTGLYVLKSNFLVGAVITGAGLVIVAMIQMIPEPRVKKYKLTAKEIDEIIQQTQNDAIEREVKFLNKEKDSEIIEAVAGWDFEESLIALHTIEHTHPNLVIGKGVQL